MYDVLHSRNPRNCNEEYQPPQADEQEQNIYDTAPDEEVTTRTVGGVIVTFF